MKNISLSQLLYEQENIKPETPTRKRAKKFAAKVRDDLYPILIKQAQFVIDCIKNKKRPSDPEVVDYMNYYMKRYTDINPIATLDTYGVSMMLSYLIKDQNVASRAKRYYRGIIDAWLKKKI